MVLMFDNQMGNMYPKHITKDLKTPFFRNFHNVKIGSTHGYVDCCIIAVPGGTLGNIRIDIMNCVVAIVDTIINVLGHNDENVPGGHSCDNNVMASIPTYINMAA
ncbi:hypothetical protein HDU76_007317, partial [Blyttiomyces sp. JEL0837]